jgi:hypothetical protein
MAEVSEGLLGRMPEGTESIAELMLFDSDINVYGESNVYIPEFDFRNRVTKNTNAQKSKKSQKDNLQREQRNRVRMNYKFGQQQNIRELQDAPETIKNREQYGYNNNFGVPADSIDFTPSIG